VDLSESGVSETSIATTANGPAGSRNGSARAWTAGRKFARSTVFSTANRGIASHTGSAVKRYGRSMNYTKSERDDGCWEVGLADDEEPNGSIAIYKRRRKDNSIRPIASVDDQDIMDEGEDAGNIALIATAPEMYRALLAIREKAMPACVCTSGEVEPPVTYGCPLCSLEHALNTVGAKAAEVAKVVSVVASDGSDGDLYLDVQNGNVVIQSFGGYSDENDMRSAVNIMAEKLNAALLPILKAKYVEGYKRGLEDAIGCCQLCDYRGQYVGYKMAANMEAIGLDIDCPPCVWKKQIAHLETISANLETTELDRALAENQITILRIRIQKSYFDKKEPPYAKNCQFETMLY